MPTSEKQIEANRLNAERSTGPQTPQFFNEEQSEYDRHLQDFVTRFLPQDNVELRLLEATDGHAEQHPNKKYVAKRTHLGDHRGSG